jgi:hypothetical protein
MTTELNHGSDCGCNIVINCGGKNPHNNDKPEFAEVYSNANQLLTASVAPNAPGQTVLLEKTIFSTPNIDVSTAASNGQVKVNKAGWYDIATGICAALNPISSPLPVWSLSLFVNGTIVPGSTFANMTLSPSQLANEIVADVFVHLNAGDIVTLANTSVSPIQLNAPGVSQGSNAQANSAYMKIILLQAD